MCQGTHIWYSEKTERSQEGRVLRPNHTAEPTSYQATTTEGKKRQNRVGGNYKKKN